MKIVLFSHPEFLGLHSLQRFTQMLAEGLRSRGHHVDVWLPPARTYRPDWPFGLSRWLGYIDQYLLFPVCARRKMRRLPDATLVVFTDHALGPWIRLAGNRPVVVHCHDFLAQQSAIGLISAHKTSFTGRIYQAYIRRGYRKGFNFICVSKKTQADLASLLKRQCRTEVVYNGLSAAFSVEDPREARRKLGQLLNIDLSCGYLLHVGGNQWYKNRKGLVMLYNAWRAISRHECPLLMIGDAPDAHLMKLLKRSACKNDILCLSGLDDQALRLAYAGASVFVFPSIAEGFGWPVAEAMACGTLVLTTNVQPIAEVAGDAAFLVDGFPTRSEEQVQWASKASSLLERLMNMDSEQRKHHIQKGLLNIRRFDRDEMLNKIEGFYKKTLNDHDATYPANVKS